MKTSKKSTDQLKQFPVGASTSCQPILSIPILLMLWTTGVAKEEQVTRRDNRPNIVLIMADDMGYEALSVNGSESCKSPNLDKLAAEGVRFSNCFSNPICTPSRAKIMTGQYNVRNYVKFGLLDRGQTTFAHQLKAAGYATCIAGKWQLGNQADSPQHFGFEQSCLWQHTRTGRSKEGGKTIDRRFVNPLLEFNGKEKDFVNGQYGPQVCTDFVCDFIDSNKDKPFLVYFPMILTHCPFDPTPDSSDWDPKRLGSTTYKGDRKDPQRYFRDMVAYADKLVGQVVTQLEKSGLRDDTLLIFTGDNGTDKPIVTSWNGTQVVGGKGSMTDMGTRVPCLASWPAGIKQTGRVVDDLVEFCDVLPTLCEVAGAELPKNYPGDGSSIVPILQNKAGIRKKEWIYIWYRGQVMVRNKQYSLVAKIDGSNARLTRYKGPFDGKKIAASDLSKPEKLIKREFQATAARLAKTRLSSVSQEGRSQVEQPKKNRKKAAKKTIE
ncbi:sulfatase-like hydrolase/transferase [Mariniblastus sp.]|nr:sulfatase-like hydrolase/transferase [Mariniblastus sp.]MDB4756474.1 sulfatase-like hydrolase/transferase [Mariniblastus sp.]